MPAGTHVASLAARLAQAQVAVLEAPDAILRRELADIDRASQMIVLDELPLRREIGQHLLLAMRRRPTLKIVIVADGLDEASGGTPREYFQALEQAGAIVARIRLDRLPDPAPLYSAFGASESPGGATLSMRQRAASAQHCADSTPSAITVSSSLPTTAQEIGSV